MKWGTGRRQGKRMEENGIRGVWKKEEGYFHNFSYHFLFKKRITELEAHH